MNEQPDFYEVTVTVKMTPEQRAAYARDFGAGGSVPDEVRELLQATVQNALSDVEWLRRFAAYSVSQAR